jgi:hypothetical protein
MLEVNDDNICYEFHFSWQSCSEFNGEARYAN